MRRLAASQARNGGTATRPGPKGDKVNRLRQNPWAVLLVLSMGFFMILLDTTIVNIAIPSIIDDLHASLGQILWVINSYILVYAVLLINAGRLGDMYGQRNLFIGGLVLFTAASAFSGLSQSTNQLIAGRVLQGIGGAMLTPQTLAILTTIFSPDRRGAAFGIWGIVAGIAAITGPTLGGLIVTRLSWQWIFYVNLPIGVIVLAAALLIVPDLRPGRKHRLDLIGDALTSAGLFCIVFGLIEGEQFDWGTIWGWLTIPEVILLGVLILVVFVVWERFQPEPMIPLSLFSNRNYLLMNWLSVVLSFGMLGLFFPITIYLQSALGLSALAAGLTMAPLSVVAMLMAPISGRLADRIGGKYILMGGLSLFALGMAALDWQATPQSSWSTFIVPLLVAGAGQGFVFAPLTTVAMRQVDPRVAGTAAGVLTTNRQLGGVIGSSVVGAVLQSQLADALYRKAVAFAAQLPPQVRDPFIAGFGNAAQGGLAVGPGESGLSALPPGIPPQYADQVARVAHDVFVNGFIAAMRPTLVVPIAVLLLGALSCLAIIPLRREPGQGPGGDGEAAGEYPV